MLRAVLPQATPHALSYRLFVQFVSKYFKYVMLCHRNTHTLSHLAHMKRRNSHYYGASRSVLYNITPDISSDFTHLEARQLSHLFSRSKIAAFFIARLLLLPQLCSLYLHIMALGGPIGHSDHNTSAVVNMAVGISTNNLSLSILGSSCWDLMT